MVDWSISLGDILMVAGAGVSAFVVLGQLRDTVRDLKFLVKQHDETIEDHEIRIRAVELRRATEERLSGVGSSH